MAPQEMPSVWGSGFPELAIWKAQLNQDKVNVVAFDDNYDGPPPGRGAVKFRGAALYSKAATWNSFQELIKLAEIAASDAAIAGRAAGRGRDAWPAGCNAPVNAAKAVGAGREDGERTGLHSSAASGIEVAGNYARSDKKAPTERNETLLCQLKKAVATCNPSLQSQMRRAHSGGIALVDSGPVAGALFPEPGVTR